MAAAKALIRAGVLTKFQAGQLLAGKYKGLRFDRLKILDRIGSGGMGTVFLCEHLGLRKRVAVKVLPPDQAGDEGVRERFFREARAAAALDHPNIVRVHDTNSSGGVHYIVMEYVDGQDLQTILNKYGALPHTRACTYIAQAALGLQHAFEKGLVHRDIKPANLLVDKDGVVKILDMGLALFHEDDKDNLTAKFDKGAVLGTADYMAPEQIMASSSVDIRADIYSLGVTLYTLINGKPPFGGSATQKLIGHTTHRATSLTEVRREVPKNLSAVVDKMMAKDPAERFQTPADVIQALTPWLEADTIPLEIQHTRKMPGTKLSRRKRPVVAGEKSKLPLIIGAVAVSALLFGGLGVWALSGGDKPDKTAAAANNPNSSPVNAPSNTKPVGNPGTTAPFAAASSRDEAKLVYEIDFGKLSPFAARFDNKQRISMEGSYPAGWTAQSWRAGAVAEVLVQEHAGYRGVVLRTNSGSSSAELHTPAGGSPYRFTPGRRYLLRTEYANVGTKTGSFEVRFDAQRPPVPNAVQLKPTRGEWQTTDLTFTAPQHERSATYFTHYNGVAPDFLVIRTVQLYEYSGTGNASAPPPTRSEVVYETDFSSLPRFQGTMAKPGGLSMQVGRFPDGWNCFVWKDGAAGEVGQEEFAGKKGIGFRTTTGGASAEITTNTGRPPKATVKAGHRYRVEIEYAAPGTAGGRLDLRLADASKPGSDQVKLNPTGSNWRKATLEYTIPNDKDYAFNAFISNYGVGQENTLYIRNLTLTDLTAAPLAVADAGGGATLYRFAAGDCSPFRANLTDGMHVSSANDPAIPAGFIAGIWKKEDAGEVAIENIAGRKGLSLKNADGSVSVQFFAGSGIAELRGGQTYTLKVTHWGAANSGGRVEIRKPQGVNRIYTHQLKGTNGQWVESTARFTPDEDGPVHMYIQNGAGGEDGKVAVQSVELFAPGDVPLPAGNYQLRLSGTTAFAKRYKKEAVLASQGNSDLPAPWAAHTLLEDTTGDVFVDPLGGQLVLGLRNHEGPPSMELYTKSELVSAKAGKKYAVKLSYQTEPNGKGWFQVAVNGKQANRSELATTSSAWKDVEVTVTASADGPLTLTIGCDSVGSESSVFIKAVEVRPLP
jgi:serine/threonine protein kinase